MREPQRARPWRPAPTRGPLRAANGKITDVTYKTTVGDNHSAQIEARAIPTLKAAVLAANSADVSTVSGATYTSNKYLSSLQSALDKAA